MFTGLGSRLAVGVRGIGSASVVVGWVVVLFLKVFGIP